MTDIKITANFYFPNGSRQVMNMCQDAYDNMKGCIDISLKHIAHDLRAVRFDYYIAK